MAFTDNFTGSSGERLYQRTGWNRVEAQDTAAINASNQVKFDSVVDCTYQCTDQSDTAHYTQVARPHANGKNYWDCCIRLTNKSNWICARYAVAGSYQVYKNDAGSSTQIGSSYSASASASDVFYLHCDSSDNIVFKLNGTERCTSSSNDTFNNTETRQGFFTRSNTQDPALDDWEAGAYSAGGGTTYTKTTSFDALLSKASNLKTTSIDALLQKTLTLQTSIDAILKSTRTKTTDFDALLFKAGVTKTTSLDSLLQKTLTKTTSLDSLLQATLTLTASLDALLQKTITKTTSLDSLLQQTLTKTISIDAVLSSAGATTITTTLDALLQQTLTITLTVDALLRKNANLLTASIDSVIIKRGLLTSQLDAILSKAGITLTVSIDSVLTALSSAVEDPARFDVLIEMLANYDGITEAVANFTSEINVIPNFKGEIK